MAHPTYKDAGGVTRSRKGTGAAGTDGDPDVLIDNIGSIPAGAIAAGAFAAGSIVDGADLGLGAIADAAVAAGATGSVSAKLRRLTTDLSALLTELMVKADPTEAQLTVGSMAVVDVAFTTDTAAYASGDVLAATQEIAGALRLSGGSCTLDSINLHDISDQGVAMDVLFFRSNTILGTENAAPDIDDTEILEHICTVPVPATKWRDLGGARVATLGPGDEGIGARLYAVTGTSLWVALLNGTGAPTFAANALSGIFAFSNRS